MAKVEATGWTPLGEIKVTWEMPDDFIEDETMKTIAPIIWLSMINSLQGVLVEKYPDFKEVSNG